MFKRIMLVLTFIAAFSTVGIGLSNQAQAWRGGGYYYGGPYGAYYAPRVAYYRQPVVPYRAYYGPRIVRPFYPVYYAAPAYSAYYAAPAYSAYYAAPAYSVYYDGYYGAPDGVSISVGF